MRLLSVCTIELCRVLASGLDYFNLLQSALSSSLDTVVCVLHNFTVLIDLKAEAASVANGSSELRLREISELRRHKLRNPGVEKAQIHSGSDHTMALAGSCHTHWHCCEPRMGCGTTHNISPS